MEADIIASNHGSIFTFLPLTEVGTQWIEDNLPEDRLTLGDAVCVEHRYAPAIYDGMVNDGLVVE